MASSDGIRPVIDPRVDDMLAHIAGECMRSVSESRHPRASLSCFLATFFSFLARKTDVYMLASDGHVGSRMGFAPGEAEAVVVSAFRSIPLQPLPGLDSKRAPPSRVPEPPPDATLLQGRRMRVTERGVLEPVGNGGGGLHDGTPYFWTQTVRDVNLNLMYPVRAGKARFTVHCSTSTMLTVADGERETRIPLPAPVRVSDLLWTSDSMTPTECGRVPVDPRNVHDLDVSRGATVVSITLEKVVHTWWTRAVAGSASEIDATRVDSTQSVGEYDDDTQAAIRKIMYEQAHGGGAARAEAAAAAMMGRREQCDDVDRVVDAALRATARPAEGGGPPAQPSARGHAEWAAAPGSKRGVSGDG